MLNNLSNKKILFCGSSQLSVGVLDFLKSQNIFPDTIITQPAKPVGRKKVLTETVVSDWVKKVEGNGKMQEIKVLKPEKFDGEFLKILRPHPGPLLLKEREEVPFDLCLVASYGKILKQEFLDTFPDGVWNIHPSELPKYRGATPLQAQIIDGLKEIEVTVIKMDAGMDSGDVLATGKMDFDWEQKNISELEYEAGFLGGKIFCENINNYLGLPRGAGHRQILVAQNQSKATFTKILKKEDGDVTSEIENIKNKININNNLEIIWRKFNAFRGWPGIFFLLPRQNSANFPTPSSEGETQAPAIRVKITQMNKDKKTDLILIEKVLPESKKEISLDIFEKNYGKIF